MKSERYDTVTHPPRETPGPAKLVRSIGSFKCSILTEREAWRRRLRQPIYLNIGFLHVLFRRYGRIHRILRKPHRKMCFACWLSGGGDFLGLLPFPARRPVALLLGVLDLLDLFGTRPRTTSSCSIQPVPS
jgi:hypothetical protein